MLSCCKHLFVWYVWKLLIKGIFLRAGYRICSAYCQLPIVLGVEGTRWLPGLQNQTMTCHMFSVGIFITSFKVINYI